MTGHAWATDPVRGQRCAACGARRVWVAPWGIRVAGRYILGDCWHGLMPADAMPDDVLKEWISGRDVPRDCRAPVPDPPDDTCLCGETTFADCASRPSHVCGLQWEDPEVVAAMNEVADPPEDERVPAFDGTEPCGCGQTTIADCATRPSRHCGQWDAEPPEDARLRDAWKEPEAT